MRASLDGKATFEGVDVRALSSVLAEMEPVIARSAELRRTRPEMASQLDRYKSQLLELQNTVEKLRVTLLVQKATIEMSQNHLHATSRWCEAFRRTR
jgi:hypothetical protein